MNSLLCWQMFELGRICARWDNTYRMARYVDAVEDVASELCDARDNGAEMLVLAKLHAMGERIAVETGDQHILDVYRALAMDEAPVTR